MNLHAEGGFCLHAAEGSGQATFSDAIVPLAQHANGVVNLNGQPCALCGNVPARRNARADGYQQYERRSTVP